LPCCQAYGKRWAEIIGQFDSDCRNVAQEKDLNVCLEEGKQSGMDTIIHKYCSARQQLIDREQAID